MDLHFQGLAWFNKGSTPDNVARARSFFDRALAADPDNVDALIGSAARGRDRGRKFLCGRSAWRRFAAAEAKLTKALSSVPDHALGHMWLGLVDILTKRAAQGIAECEHALALDRNLAERPFRCRIWQDFCRSRRRNRGSHCRGPAPKSARYDGLCLDEYGGPGEAPPRKLRAGGRVVSTVDRGQSKFSVCKF